MASLVLRKAELESQVATTLGWGPGEDFGGETWDAQTKALLKGFIDSGYARFINTPEIKGVHPGGYDWSFLKPKMRLLAPADTERLMLPEDFHGFTGELTIEQDTGSNLPIRLGNDSQMAMERQKAPTRTGRPLLAVIRTRKGDPAHYDLDLWPKTDAEYVLVGLYNLSPEALTDASPIAYGGAIHRETLLQSCLAVAEERWDRVNKGPQFNAFMMMLAASIRKDRELKPMYYGYDADKSDQLHHAWKDFPPIKVNGAVPSSVST